MAKKKAAPKKARLTEAEKMDKAIEDQKDAIKTLGSKKQTSKKETNEMKDTLIAEKEKVTVEVDAETAEEIEEMLNPTRPKLVEMISRKKGAIQDPTKSVTRTEAIENGYTLYWNGAPCSIGHFSPRYASSGECKKCYQLFRAEEISSKDICRDKLPRKPLQPRVKKSKKSSGPTVQKWTTEMKQMVIDAIFNQ